MIFTFNDIKKYLINFKTISILLIVILLISLGASIRSCQHLESKYDNNIKALNDSIRYHKSKSGEIVAQKTAYLVDNIKELKQLNNDLYDKVKNLNISGTPQSAIYIKGDVEYLPQDTAYIIHHDTISNGFTKSFNFDDKWRQLQGDVTYKNDSLGVYITKDAMQFDYTLAIDKKNQIHVTSDNPYVKYNEITGFTLPKQKRKSIVIGPSVSFGYDPLNNKMTPTIGISATYNLFGF